MVKMLGNPVHRVFEINNGLISATADHPFYLKKSDDTIGWGAIDIHKAKKSNTFEGNFLKMEEGDKLLKSNGEWIEITSIKATADLVQTYNILSFSGTRTYFANDLLVYEEHPTYLISSNFLEFLFEQFPNVYILIHRLNQRIII
jgi:hypothetical protein